MDALIICIVAISIAYIKNISTSKELRTESMLEVKHNDDLIEYTDAFMHLLNNIEKRGSGLP